MSYTLEDGFKISGFNLSTIPFNNSMTQMSFIRLNKSYEQFSPVVFNEKGLSMSYVCYKLIEQSCTCEIQGKLQIQSPKEEYEIFIKINEDIVETIKIKSKESEIFEFNSSQINIDLNQINQNSAVLSISIDAVSFVSPNKLYDINFNIQPFEQQETFLKYIRPDNVKSEVNQDTSTEQKIFLTANGEVNKFSSFNIFALRLIPLPEDDEGKLWEPEDGDYANNISQCNNNIIRYLNLTEEDKKIEKNFNIFNNSLSGLERRDIIDGDNIVKGIVANNNVFEFNKNQIGYAKPEELKEDKKIKEIFFWLRTSDKNCDFKQNLECSLTSSDVCLSGDTLITMADETTKKLNSICKGELVLANNGKITKVVDVKSNGINPFYILYHFENNIDIKEVFPHRFYNKELGFWEHLQNWKIGEHALTMNGEKIALLSKEIICIPEEGFGLFTEEGSYFANGLLSGPASCNKKLLSKRGLKEAVKVASNLSNSQLRGLLQIEDF